MLPAARVEAGEEQQQVVFELEHCGSRQPQRLDADAMVRVKSHARDAAVRGNILILFTNRFL